MLLERLARRAAAIVIVCLFGTNVSYVAAGEPPSPTNGTSRLGGWVYIDRNNDGVINFATHENPEWMIADVTIELYSQNDLLTPLRTTQTDEHGRFFFANLDPGSYSLKQIQPIQYVDGKDTLGQIFSLTGGPPPAGSSAGSMLNNAFNNIVLPANSHGDYFAFGERGWAMGYASKRFLEGYEPVFEFGEDEPGFVIPEPATLWIAAMAAGFAPRRRRRSVSRNRRSGVS